MNEPSQANPLARFARQSLTKIWAKPFCDWLDRLSSISSNADDIFVLAHCLATLQKDFEFRYARSGSEVQELIFDLHRMLASDDFTKPKTPAAIVKYIPWIGDQLTNDHSDSFKRIMILWIDIQSERLTMRTYSQSGMRKRHAQILVSRPARYLLGGAFSKNDDSDPTAGDLDNIADLLLHFCDHLRADDELKAGRNLIEETDAHKMSGFYALHGDVATPEENQEALLLDRLDEQWRSINLETLCESHKTLIDDIAGQIREAIAHRRDKKEWPKEFLRPAPSNIKKKDSLWTTLRAKLFSPR